MIIREVREIVVAFHDSPRMPGLLLLAKAPFPENTFVEKKVYRAR
jgi:hypothetical protein